MTTGAALPHPLLAGVSNAPVRKRRNSRGWQLVALITALAALLPIAAVVYLSIAPSDGIWSHLWSTVLPRYIQNTIVLMLGVGICSALLGFGSAWLIALYDFPGRRWLSWALLLPFAVPAYVIAYVYTDLLQYAGPIQLSLRAFFGWERAADYWFPHIRSLGGAVIMFALVLYPYVYLTCRTALLEQSDNLMLASRVLGAGPARIFFRILLPICRPALAVGLSLVLMETLNDYGTVSYFAVQTLTAGLYDTWLNMGSVSGAAQIAVTMVGFALLLMFLERASRRSRERYSSSNRQRAIQPRKLRGWHAWLATLACLLPITLGFLVPCAVLLDYAISYFDVSWNSRFFSYAGNSLFLSGMSALVLIVVGTVLSYSIRIQPSRVNRLLARLSCVGYAMPGAVLALGVIIPFAATDNWIDSHMEAWTGEGTGLLLSGTTFAIIFAYCTRFATISIGSIESGMQRITPSMDQAATMLGSSPLNTLRRIHLPLLRPSLLTAALIIFVDCMKELPATLILRPFNFETLATFVYQYASDEQLAQSSLAALCIVVAGLLPLLLLNRASMQQHNM
ncbi:ABC transporter permease [Allohahella sp. A8]|uniref:ABC transporter permease n=1 Tax=Allohahella sp. A8 TaxID=3141461 RepID=UPI000C0B435A|nr:iron ABC transporter permease [Hahellaceae bacterium]|tara:strand:+ start:79750 stop:81447 length:1698 start_codon:yes stop_codon:yes gene_type:complete